MPAFQPGNLRSDDCRDEVEDVPFQIIQNAHCLSLDVIDQAVTEDQHINSGLLAESDVYGCGPMEHDLLEKYPEAGEANAATLGFAYRPISELSVSDNGKDEMKMESSCKRNSDAETVSVEHEDSLINEYECNWALPSYSARYTE